MATHLHWAIKKSLTDYVRRSDDGRLIADGGAIETETGEFVFPVDTVDSSGICFSGRVRLQAHNKMLDLIIESPRLEPRADGWVLTVVDPDRADARIELVKVEGTTTDSGLVVGTRTTLTAVGADYFVSSYSLGTSFENPRTENHA